MAYNRSTTVYPSKSTKVITDVPYVTIFPLNESYNNNNSYKVDEHIETYEEFYARTYLFHGYAVVVPLSMLMIAFIVLSVIGNVMVIMTIARHNGMRTRTNMFIVNLAVADILVAVLDMPISLATVMDGGWLFGIVMCHINGFTMALCLICSIHTLMYISIHKYISITRPFSRIMTPRKIKMMIAASWIWATLCAIGPICGWNEIIYKKGASQCGPNVPEDTKAKIHSLFITTTNYVIPLTVMFFCYYKIFNEISVHMKNIRETSNIELPNSVSQQKKVSVTLFLVLACFLICWTPFIIYSTTLAFMKDKSKMPAIANPLAYWCGYMNSACNPIIYAFRSPSFRQGYKQIMCGTPAYINAANSLSFRSRSSKQSQRSRSGSATAQTTAKPTTSNQKKLAGPGVQRQRTLLSQTSWISVTIIPYFTRRSLRSTGDPDANTNKRPQDSDENLGRNLKKQNSHDSDDQFCFKFCFSSRSPKAKSSNMSDENQSDNESQRKQSGVFVGEDTAVNLDVEEYSVSFSSAQKRKSEKPRLIRQDSFDNISTTYIKKLETDKQETTSLSESENDFANKVQA